MSGTGRSIGEALERWLTERGVAQERLARRGVDTAGTWAAIVEHWAEAAGPQLAAASRPARIDGTSLVVAVEHPAIGVELGFRSAELLDRLGALAGTSGLERLKVIVRGTSGLE